MRPRVLLSRLQVDQSRVRGAVQRNVLWIDYRIVQSGKYLQKHAGNTGRDGVSRDKQGLPSEQAFVPPPLALASIAEV